MAEVAEALAQYLEAASRTAFAWGTADCCTFAADWVRLRTGLDPMEALRGRYHGEAGARTLMATHGGLEAGWAARLASLPLTDTPQPGDVAVIMPAAFTVPAMTHRLRMPRGGTVAQLETQHGDAAFSYAAIGAIRTSNAWAMLCARGLMVAQGEALSTWEVG